MNAPEMSIYTFIKMLEIFHGFMCRYGSLVYLHSNYINAHFSLESEEEG